MLTQRGKQLRKEAYYLAKQSGGYHHGGTFSTIELLYVLYDNVMTKHDKFILSKGHACWGLYAILREKGYNPSLDCHPHLDTANGIDWTTGSEGHGMPAGIGMAFAKKKLKKEGRVFVLVGDGECQEGTTWESLLIAGKHGLDNLTVIMDNNQIQGSGFTDDILPVGDKIGKVAKLCGWDVSTIDGHDEAQIYGALINKSDSRPQFIVANTIKGKGVDFMENRPEWHSKWPNLHEEVQLLIQLS